MANLYLIIDQINKNILIYNQLLFILFFYYKNNQIYLFKLLNPIHLTNHPSN